MGSDCARCAVAERATVAECFRRMTAGRCGYDWSLRDLVIGVTRRCDGTMASSGGKV